MTIFSHVRKFDPSALYPFLSLSSPHPSPLIIEVKLLYRGPDKHGGHEEILTNVSEEKQTAKYDQIISLSFTDICDVIIMLTGRHVLVEQTYQFKSLIITKNLEFWQKK